MSGIYQCSILQYPSGRYGLVGSVPGALAYTRVDGSVPTDQEIDDDLRLPGNYRRLKNRTYASREEAQEAIDSWRPTPVIDLSDDPFLRYCDSFLGASQ